MLGFLNSTSSNLRNLTFATCIIGGLHWSNLLLPSCLNIENKTNDKTIVVKDLGARAITSAFYYYIALGVNSFLIDRQMVNMEDLCRGYYVVFGSLMWQTFNNLEYVKQWREKYLK